jgi:hypothetical protein
MALFNCPKCSWRVKFTDNDLGKKGKCLQCSHEFVFPSTLAKEPPAVQKQTPLPPPRAGQARSLTWLIWPLLAAVAVLVPAGFVVLFLAGREPPKPVVFGKVRYKNELLTGGTISFLGDDGIVQGKIEKDGSYEVVDPPSGLVKVSIRSISPFLQKEKGDKIKWTTRSLIPTKYNDPKASGLSYTIGRGGRQEINIELRD